MNKNVKNREMKASSMKADKKKNPISENSESTDSAAHVTPIGGSSSAGAMSTTSNVVPKGDSNVTGSMTALDMTEPVSGTVPVVSGDKPDWASTANDVSGNSGNNEGSRGDTYAGYVDDIYSKIVNDGNEYYDNADSMQAPEYESRYDSQIQGLLDKILNGEKFDYNVNEDALYANYADIYERNARKAAEDAMGRSAAASGGYGSSFASAVAGQAYNSQMQGLNEIVPELQQLAYNQYLANRQDEYNQLSTIRGLEDSDYLRFRDNMSDFYADRDYNVSMGDRYYDNLYNSADFAQGIVENEQAQSNWQAEYDADREDTEWEHGRIEDRDDRADYESDRDFNADREDTEWEHGRIEDRDDRADFESDRAFDADREDTEWEHGFAEDQFEHEKSMDESAQNLSEAVAAAEHGDYSLLEWYTGADLSDAKEWDKIMKGAELYSATGLVDYLKAAGVDTTILEDNIADEEYAENLSIALSVYEATGSPAMLQALGIDTAYMDKILGYYAKQEENKANGSSGGSGGGSYSGGGSGGGSGSGSGGSSGSSSGSTFSGNDTTEYWIANRLSEKHYKNYIAHRDSNITYTQFVADTLNYAVVTGEISKEEYSYLCDYYGIE